MSTTTHKIAAQILVFQGGGDVAEDLDEVGEWRGRRSDILDVREGGDTIRWGRAESHCKDCDEFEEIWDDDIGIQYTCMVA